MPLQYLHSPRAIPILEAYGVLIFPLQYTMGVSVHLPRGALLPQMEYGG